MHYQLEIIMPPTGEIEAAISEILAPFDENLDRGDENANGYPFWDWWQLGGRWSGNKLLDILGRDRIDEFHAILNENHVTVSSLQFGKPTLNPVSQVSLVDRLWRDHFADAPTLECPLFDHVKQAVGDVMRLANTPARVSCSHVIIAGPGWKAGTLQAQTMLTQDIWNGVSIQPTRWDGTLGAALEVHAKSIESTREDLRVARTPQPDWLVVTVDYHS